nr:hypothetical protein [Paenibacillus sp. sptzw28]
MAALLLPQLITLNLLAIDNIMKIGPLAADANAPTGCVVAGNGAGDGTVAVLVEEREPDPQPFCYSFAKPIGDLGEALLVKRATALLVPKALALNERVTVLEEHHPRRFEQSVSLQFFAHFK